MEEDTGKSLHVGGATGRIHGADYSLVDYNRAGIPLDRDRHQADHRRRRAGAPRSRKAYVAAAARALLGPSASPTSGWSRARCAATSTCRWPPPGAGTLGHPHRDQERQLAALGRAGRRATRCSGTPRSSAGGGVDPAGDPALARGHRHHHRRVARSPTPRTTATSPSPTWCRSRRRASGSRSCARRCPSRRARAARGCRRTGASPTSRCATPSEPGALDLVEETIAAGAVAAGRAQVVARASWPGAPTSAGVDLAALLGVTPADVARVAGPGRRGPAQRQAGPPGLRRACSPARAPPTRSSPRAGSAVVSDDGALSAAVDDAIAAQPRRRRQDPRRQGRRRRCAHRRGDEGDARPGRRRPGPRADPRAARPVLTRPAGEAFGCMIGV